MEDNSNKITETVIETIGKSNAYLESKPIKYDGKELTSIELKNKIIEWRQSLTDDCNENYLKFNKFCEKLDEGAFIWHYGKPYDTNYCGYHSNGRKSNYFVYQTQTNPEMIFHGSLCRSEPSGYLNRDRSSGYLAKDSNLKFYFVPKSELKLISNLHDIISPYYKIEDLLKTIPKELKNIVYSFCGRYDHDLDMLINNHVINNMKEYSILPLN